MEVPSLSNFQLMMKALPAIFFVEEGWESFQKPSRFFENSSTPKDKTPNFSKKLQLNVGVFREKFGLLSNLYK